MEPTRGSPLGCVIGLLALMPLGLMGVGVYGWITWASLAVDKRPEEALSLWISCTVGGAIFTIGLIWIAVKVLKNTDWKSYDPDRVHSRK